MTPRIVSFVEVSCAKVAPIPALSDDARTTLCAVVLCFAQTLRRLEQRCGTHPGVIDREVLKHAHAQIINLRALLNMTNRGQPCA